MIDLFAFNLPLVRGEGRSLLQVAKNRTTDDISGCKFSIWVVIKGKSPSLPIDEMGTFSPHSFADEKAGRTRFCQSSGVKLYELQVSQNCPSPASDRYSISSTNFWVSCLSKYLTPSTRCQHDGPRPHPHHPPVVSS